MFASTEDQYRLTLPFDSEHGDVARKFSILRDAYVDAYLGVLRTIKEDQKRQKAELAAKPVWVRGAAKLRETVSKKNDPVDLTHQMVMASENVQALQDELVSLLLTEVDSLLQKTGLGSLAVGASMAYNMVSDRHSAWDNWPTTPGDGITRAKSAMELLRRASEEKPEPWRNMYLIQRDGQWCSLDVYEMDTQVVFYSDYFKRGR